MTDTYISHPTYQRSSVGVYRLTVAHPNKQGNDGLIVVVEHFMKHVATYPSKDYLAHSLALVLPMYFTTY